MDAMKQLTFLEAVLINPAMYTMNGTFEEAIAFLEGYFSGIARSNPYVAPVVEWSAFRIWLAEKLGTDLTVEFQALRATCGNSDTALQKMLDYVVQFRSESAVTDELELSETAR